MRYSILVFAFFVFGCGLKKYAKGVASDSRLRFDAGKDFIFGMSFRGAVDDKIVCEKCKTDKYRIKIRLFQLNPHPDLFESRFEPYYSFQKDTILFILVSQKLFSEADKKNLITKNSKNFNLIVGDCSLPYLSPQKEKWLDE